MREIAKIVPFKTHESQTLSERLTQLENAGLLVRNKGDLSKVITQERPGALMRFIKDRD